MARWDEILSLPVQSPPTLEFSASDLVWSKVEGWKENIDRVAVIPFSRVNDFIRGESSNKDCPTGFHVEARRRPRHDSTFKVKVDSILEYILYWCSFGPDDHRKGGIVRPSRTIASKKKSAGRPNTKRGCTCHFIVKRLCAEPSVALIIYNQDKHVDKKGLPCHGPQDKKSAGTRAMYSPFISEELRLRVYSLLYVGVSVETIMQRHNELVEKQGGPSNRDDLLTHRYVRTQERSIRRYKYELDADDAVSLGMWVDSHPTCVFFYEEFSDSEPFTIGIQTDWQLQQMIRFGDRSLLASDSRFGSNKFKYPVHSLLVFNSENKPIPVAWIISPRFSSRDAYKWMRALYNRVLTKNPAWNLAGFIVDDPLIDITAIRDVFNCSVMMSIWRIRHVWHKNLMKRCSANEMRLQMSKRLGNILSDICSGRGNLTSFDEFMKDFADNGEFVEYFKAVWHPRIGSWITALQRFQIASQETSASIECYHQQMHVRVFNEKNLDVYQRVDWLVDKLATKVHSYYWLDEYPGKDDFSRYWKDEWINELTSWRDSLNIPDSDVILEDQCAEVSDEQACDKVYIVLNPGSELSICSCPSSERGYLCEHICKVTQMFRKKDTSKPSLSLNQYKEALIKLLHCVPHDSLIRDHAVSLTAFLQTQLNALGSFDSDERMIDDQQGQNGNLGNADGRLVNHDAGGQGSCDESAFQDEMDIDPSSICMSPSGLFAMHGVLPADILLANGMEGIRPPNDGFSSRASTDIGHNAEEPKTLPVSVESHDPCSVINQHGEDFSDDIAGSDDFNDLDIDHAIDERLLHLAKKRKTTNLEEKENEEIE
ncbi:hypothetical protein RND81_01G185800 [Saponaria officinalis]|uniref:SWIM-type domain-containing protein n=1 Tax=Saponaria officinalis TaxID=3572 RepID=A0AAW1N8J6_SAPOF